MHRNVKGLATSVEHIVMSIISQGGMICCTHYQFLLGFCMKLTVGTLGIGGDLLRIKSDFVFVRLVRLKSVVHLKVNGGLNNS